MESAKEPVTVIITRVVRMGTDSAFEDAVKAFIPKSLASSGRLGVHMLCPSSAASKGRAKPSQATHCG